MKTYINIIIAACLSMLIFCKPQNKQIYIDAPVKPGADSGQAPQKPGPSNENPAGVDTTLPTMALNISLENQCNEGNQTITAPSNPSEDLHNNNSGASTSELDEARARETGRRAGVEPGEFSPVVSRDFGPMYLKRDQNGIYHLTPAFENDDYFIEQSFSVPKEQLTEDGQNFRRSSLEDSDTTLYISVQSPEFGIQNCSVKEVCEESDQNSTSDLYLLRHHSDLFNNLRALPVQKSHYENKNYTVYALSPQFKQFCGNQSAKLNTRPHNNDADDNIEMNNVDLSLKQEALAEVSNEDDPDSSTEFKTYFSKGKDNQAVIYFISNNVWYIALENMPDQEN